MRTAPTVAEFEAGLGLAWAFELTPLERQCLARVADLQDYVHRPWDELTPALRLRLAQAALEVCELAAKVAPDLER